MSIVSTLVSRADGWVNALTGLGTLRDKVMHAQVVPGGKLGDGTLEAMFNDDDLARKICSKIPRDATRRGFTIKMEGVDEDESVQVQRDMEDALRALDAFTKMRDAWIWARLYGGGGVFVGADDGQSPDQPLDETRIRTIAFLNVVKRPYITIAKRFEDVSAGQYGEPELYEIRGPRANPGAQYESVRLHASRFIMFPGALTADAVTPNATGWDDSVLQGTHASLQQTATAWQSVAHLVSDASQGVLKIANLVDLIASNGQEALRTRISMMDLARSVCRAILVDADRESFERVATSFAGLPEIMDRLMMRVASAAEQPVTLLFGRSPAGLNATGESDIRGWYDTVADAQNDILKPRLEYLLRVMFAANDSPTRGKVPDHWCVEFNPLWQPTEKEHAEQLKVTADTYAALVNASIMMETEAALGLSTDFPTIDVEHRRELLEADVEEGVRPGQDPDADDPDDDEYDEDDEGGAPDGDRPKGRTDADQPRVPSGSPQGGQFASKGGPAASLHERRSFLAGPRTAYAAARAAHGAAPGEHTERALVQAQGELREARKRAASSAFTPQEGDRAIQYEVERLHELRRREPDASDPDAGQLETWRRGQEDQVLRVMASQRTQARYVEATTEIHAYNVSEPRLRHERAKWQEDAETIAGEWSSVRNYQKHVTERLKEHVDNERDAALERITRVSPRTAEPLVSRMARTTALARAKATHKQAAGVVKRLHDEAVALLPAARKRGR